MLQSRLIWPNQRAALRWFHFDAQGGEERVPTGAHVVQIRQHRRPVVVDMYGQPLFLSVVLDIGLAEGGIQTAFLAHLLEETVQQTPASVRPPHRRIAQPVQHRDTPEGRAQRAQPAGHVQVGLSQAFRKGPILRAHRLHEGRAFGGVQDVLQQQHWGVLMNQSKPLCLHIHLREKSSESLEPFRWEVLDIVTLHFHQGL
mmetsp:Transcript_4225/g.9841  ORF Transcript_4225/g.9841 Transcript_4225/m.9841 type:complete len:200 (-) Transcript_4225:206-805(-)